MSKTITIHDQEGNYREYVVSARAQLLPGVFDGCEVRVGQQLTKGSVNPHDLLRLTDPQHDAALHREPGPGRVPCPRAWISTTSTSRSSRARCCARWPCSDAGDSDFLPGRQVNRFEFEKVANELIAEGKRAARWASRCCSASLRRRWPRIRACPAASFQETTKVLTDAAIEGKIDSLGRA